MKTLYFSVALLLFGLLFGTASGCVVEFPDELPYACETNEDCGGDNNVCASLADGRRYCCHPDPELCNNLDDDCNGVPDDLSEESCYTGPAETRSVGACRQGKPTCGNGGSIFCAGEVVPTAEVCNGKDDNCDGTVDEGFDFQTGRNNCGRCDIVCPALADCIAGQCVTRQETACDNGQDDEGDGKTDCLDSDCNSLPCGAGCTCLSGRKVETGCGNTTNDDEDALTDCADPDCDSRVCGAGCVCIGGKPGEGDCLNGVNDDAPEDTLTDCADSDCTDKSCGDGCVCRSGAKAEDLCDDGLDNDGDVPSKIDCADTDCQGKICGLGCVCATPNKKEVVCSDKLDNDADANVDCADADCNNVTFCAAGEAGSQCLQNTCKEIFCTDSNDNDKDGLTDCADPDCDGKQCITNEAGSQCISNTCRETICNDNRDNDLDGLRNCADRPDCDGKLCRRQGNTDFFCTGGVCP